MKSTHEKNLECLRGIRGCFGSRRLWCIEYEFTGEEIIERRSGRIKMQLRIFDIIETKAILSPPQLVLSTPAARMKVQMSPELYAVIQREFEKDRANMTDADRLQHEKVKADMVSRVKWMRFIGAVVVVVLVIAMGLLVLTILRPLLNRLH